MYFFCIGEIGINPDVFWSLTEGETIAKINGYHLRKAKQSADFRALYSLTYNINAKRGDRKKPEQLWHLIIDDLKTGRDLSHDDIVKRNANIRNI